MNSLPSNLHASIYEEVCNDFELLRLLDLFGEQLEKIHDVDDYVINFLDDKRENLLSLKLRFVDDEFKTLEKAYFKYKVELTDVANINARAYKESAILTINNEADSQEDRKWLQLWKVDQISSMPLKGKGLNSESLGTLLVTKKHGVIQRSTFETIQELMAIFCPMLQRAVAYFYLQEHSREFQDANEERNRFLKFIGEISNLTELQKIYTRFSNELARQLPFELAAYYLLENDKLVGKNVTIMSDQHLADHEDWAQSVVDVQYATDNPVNPVSHAFLLNRHLLFEDAQKLIDISDSQHIDGGQTIQDNAATERRALLRNGRTLLLVPIRHQNQPIGVCALYMLSSVVIVTEADLRLVEHLCTFLGAALFNGKNFTRLAAANKELDEVNIALDSTIKELSTINRELQETQKQLVEAEKMAALGQLVNGVAHEINTPVGVSYTAMTHFQKNTLRMGEIFQSGQIKKSDMTEFIALATETSEQIIANLSRASKLVQSFKQVAVDQSTDIVSEFSLDAYLKEIVATLEPVMKDAGQAIQLTCPAGINMKSFPRMLSQVVTDLVMNALTHAFDGIQHGIIKIEATKLGDKVELRCQDNGVGIPDDVLPKIFDPFFTTRRGTGACGLGLLVVYNLVVRKLSGQINCDSEVGKGTIFSLILPLEIKQ